MKTQASQKFFSFVMILGMFMIGSLVGKSSPENQDNQKVAKQLNTSQQAYWVRWNSQFKWSAQGRFNTVPFLPNEGC